MNVLKSMFGVSTESSEKGEVHDTIRRIFGNEMILKDNTNKSTQRSKYLSHIRDNLSKMLDTKSSKTKTSRKNTPTSPLTQTLGVPETDDRHGRLGPRLVVFDASTGTGRLVLVGDERVSVQGLSSFASIRATACAFAGRWMYEVQLGTKGIIQIGWCTAACQFSMDTGVGDTANSYAYDGGRVRRWNVATSSYGEAWQPGDVIGSCFDLDKGTLEYYRNGKSLGVAFSQVPHGSGLAYFPAVSLAMQEHLYANFGHVPFVYPVPHYAPLQAAPTRDCLRASILLRSLDAIVDEFIALSNYKSMSSKSSKAKTDEDHEHKDLTVRIYSKESVVSRPTPVVTDSGHDVSVISRKAFLMSLARLVVTELGVELRTSYVVVAELLPRLRAALGVKSKELPADADAAEFYAKCRSEQFVHLSAKCLKQPNTRLCVLLDLMWTFLEETALCDVLEHCVMRECLLFDVVAQDMTFKEQLESVFVLCGLMQHTETRHHLVKYVLFNKITFDNFLNLKCPDEKVLKTMVSKGWWQRPTTVEGETDPMVAEMAEKGMINRGPISPNATESVSKLYYQSAADAEIETKYKRDCEKITKAVEPLELIQLEFLLMLLENDDGTNMVPSTRKIFLEKFRRYIMDNCILDMRLFNISRTSSAISWCCHSRLLSAVLILWEENPFGTPDMPPHLPVRSYIDGELDYYNVDRLGGVLPYLVRTLRQDLVSVLGEDNAFIQSFEPRYNRGGGIDTGVSDMATGSPVLATLPQVISSMARFLNQPMAQTLPESNTRETTFAVKGTRSLMPGAGPVPARAAYPRLLDGLLALYHGAAIKQAEKLCELRDNQLDMADCLHDIDLRVRALRRELSAPDAPRAAARLKGARALTERMVKELERSKAVYEEKLEAGALQMAWVIGALWTKKHQTEMTRHFAGTLHSLRMASDSEYKIHMQAASKEVLPGNSSMADNSYASLQLEYSCSSGQRLFSTDFAEPLFAFVPEYHVDAMLELCNTLRLYMHPTVPVHLIPEWDSLVVSCAAFLCAEFADPRIVLASTRESLVQTLASFATQPATMRAIERVPHKQQLSMVEELLKPYQNRAWAQSNWVLVRFWHGSGFGFRHRQWPHLAARYGDREPTVNNLGAKVDAGLMSQCFGPCPSPVIQQRVKEYLDAHPKEAAAFLNSLLSQLNWAFSEFVTMMQEMDRVSTEAQLEPRQIKLCATCFDLYHGLARALEMTLTLSPLLLTKPEACDQQNELLLGRTCQMLMGAVSRVCVAAGGGGGFARLARRALPDTDRVHHYLALAPVAGCLTGVLRPDLPPEHLDKVTAALVSEPLFRVDGLEFMLQRGNEEEFSFYHYPEDVNPDELRALELVVERLTAAQAPRSRDNSVAQSELLCTICYARAADTAFVPCNHHSCRACIMQHLLNSKQCFFCKADIQSVKEIEPTNN